MELSYNEFGNLEEGEYEMTLADFKTTFGYTAHRKRLLEGLDIAISDLLSIGCTTIYMDGSFITKERFPSDYDLCWDDTGYELVNVKQQCPRLIDWGPKFSTMRENYLGEVVPMNSTDFKGDNFYTRLTKDRNGRKKGIIKIIIN